MVYKNTTTKYIHICLAVICIVLGALLYTELNKDYLNVNTLSTSASDFNEVINIPVLKEDYPALEDYQAIIDQPLFIKDRQPYTYEVPEEEIKKNTIMSKTIQRKPVQQLVLTATIITPDRIAAIIQTGKNKEPQHVEIGELIDNWMLEEVHTGQVVLKDGDQLMTLELEIQGSPVASQENVKKRIIQPRSVENSKKVNNTDDEKKENIVENDEDEIED